jgi:hypothetical protein
MGSTAWALALMVTLAVVIALAFTALWLQDKDRADEVAEDPERADTDTRSGRHPGSRPGPGPRR